MKKKIITSILLLIVTLSFSQKQHIATNNQQLSANYSEKDIAVFESYKTQFKDKKELDFNKLVTQTALFFLGTPYVAHTLELEPEILTVNLTQLDCTTFVETVLALSRTVKEGNPTFEKFMAQLQAIRYRNGTIEDYSSRLHYTSEWIAQNQKRGVLKNITKENGGREIYFNLNFISSNPTRYKQLKNNSHLTKIIRDSEVKTSALKNYYIPKNEIEQNAQTEANGKGFKSGDILAFVTTTKGLDISHVAFIYKEQERLTFIHASSSEKKVVIEKLSLEEYTLSSKTNKGIIVARPLY